MLKGAPRHDGILGARTMRTVLRLLNATLPTLALGGAALGAQDTTYRPAQLFDRRAVAITMRDGVRLRTLIYTPKPAARPLPILLERSPYPFGPDSNPDALRRYRELVEDGYIVVLQYIRGRYGSEGRFVQPEQMPHGHVPHRRDPKAVDESTDAYDTIDWLVNNVSGHNGRVGVIGTSYDGWLALMATVDPHPALAAAAPHASPGDVFGADDWYHNGAFRLAPSYAFAVMMAGDTMLPLRFDRADTYEWFLQAGTLSAITRRHASGSFPLWDVLLAHPERRLRRAAGRPRLSICADAVARADHALVR